MHTSKGGGRRRDSAGAVIVAALVLLLSGAASQDPDGGAGCFVVVHPPPNYVIEPDEQRSLELMLQINCPGASRARMLQLYSATGNGTAGGLLWQVQLDEHTDDMFQLSWQMLGGDSNDLDAYEHWHCSGWRQWQLVVHRESGARENALMRVRAPLLEDALEFVEQVAHLRGRPPSFVQVGAMDGVGHDHMTAFVGKGTWSGLLIEPLKDMFERLVQHYSRTSAPGAQKLQFANVCVAEQKGKRKMRRLARHAMDAHVVEALGYDGSSSLLSDTASGLPPGMALSFASLAPHTQQQVLAGLVEEEVDCAPLQDILGQYGMCSPGAGRSDREDACAKFDVFAVDTEGYDLKILQQLFGALAHTSTDGLASTRDRPAVVFLEVGLLSPPDQVAAAQLLQSQGYRTQRCGYGMEMVARLQS